LTVQGAPGNRGFFLRPDGLPKNSLNDYSAIVITFNPCFQPGSRSPHSMHRLYKLTPTNNEQKNGHASIGHHLPCLRAQTGRNNAGRCLPILLYL